MKTTAERRTTRKPAAASPRPRAPREEGADRSIVSLELQAMEDLQRLTARLTAAARHHATEGEPAEQLVELKALLAHELPLMKRQLQHMARLFDDMAEISRISERQLELNRSRVLLEDVVATAIENARPDLIEAGHELGVEIPAGPVFLDADLARLAQALGTLVSNSARYTPREGLIVVSASVEDDEVTISVRDSSRGPAVPAVESVFGFFPAPSIQHDFDRTGGGLWIGLALVKGLVEMHGGSVMAESDGPGEGTTYSIRLPIAG